MNAQAGGGASRGVGFWDDVLHGTAGAPWVWWLVALVVLVVLLAGAMKLFGLWPD